MSRRSSSARRELSVLANAAAESARRVKKIAEKTLRDGIAARPLHKLRNAWQTSLNRDLSSEEFADQYAQALVSATCTLSLLDASTDSKVAQPSVLFDSNITPFAQSLWEAHTGISRSHHDADAIGAELQTLVERIRSVPIENLAVSDNTALERSIHFYELFLKSYDANARRHRGVFYTPQPLVSHIVRRIDDALRSEFGLTDGLADTSTWSDMRQRHARLILPEHVNSSDPFVRILDPAVGTGTFLVGVIDRIHCNLTDKWRQQGLSDRQITAQWNAYVPRHLLPRLCGLEIVPAPCAIAQLQIAAKLRATGYRFGKATPIHVYLANALEPPCLTKPAGDSRQPKPTEDNGNGGRTSPGKPFTLVLGNPPYSGISANQNPWIDNLLKGRVVGQGGARSYYEVDGQPLGERKLWLQDDYVKFVRYGQWHIDRAGCGVLAYVSNHSFLDNPTFRGMRQQLLATFPRISLIDLNGNRKRRKARHDGVLDENVFDIAQGVAMSLFRAPMVPPKSSLIEYSQLNGPRESKFAALLETASSELRLQKIIPSAPYYFFVPHDDSSRKEYHAAWQITAIFPVFTSGIVTARDAFVTDFDEPVLLKRIEELRDPSLTDDFLRRKHFFGKGAAQYAAGDSRGWKLSAARQQVRVDRHWQNRIQSCAYRPFDARALYYVPWMVDWPRTQLMQHLLPAGTNLALVTCRQQSQHETPWSHVGIADRIVESSFLSNKTREIGYVLPFFLGIGAERQSNLAPDFLQELSGRVGVQEAVDVLGFIYAQLHSPTYRRRFAPMLRIDFPRVFLPKCEKVFLELSRCGSQLIGLHLLDQRNESSLVTKSRAPDVPMLVAPDYPRFTSGRIFLNAMDFIDGVSEAVWNYHVGSYRVCEKWLKDRRRRMLSHDDLAHYRKVITAIEKTIRVQQKIDKIIQLHGGWPKAFVVD